MASQEWEKVQVRTCAKVTEPVQVDQLVIYPIEYLPDSPRIVDFRCSGEAECGKDANVQCILPVELQQKP